MLIIFNIQQPNKKLAKKLPKNCEVANLLVGQMEGIDETLMAWVRLEHAATMGDLTEVELPTRFLFVVLSPTTAAKNQIWEDSEVARSVAALLCDQVGEYRFHGYYAD